MNEEGVLPPLSPTARTRLRRFPQRGRTERSELYDVLDAGLMCFVGTVVDGCPRVTPMVYGRVGSAVYLHGSVVNQSLRAAAIGEVCVTVALVDGLVLANSLFHHSVNFRSATIYGRGRLVTEPDERLTGVRVAAEQLVPGRAEVLPDPSPKQMAGTMVVAVPLAEASVKMRSGPPGGEVEDYGLDIWSGIVPLLRTWGDPQRDPQLRADVPVPPHVARLVGRPAEPKPGGS